MTAVNWGGGAVGMIRVLKALWRSFAEELQLLLLVAWQRLYAGAEV